MWWHNKNVQTIYNWPNRSIETPASVNSLSDSATCRPLEESLSVTSAVHTHVFEFLKDLREVCLLCTQISSLSPHAENDPDRMLVSFTRKPRLFSLTVNVPHLLLPAAVFVQSDCSSRWTSTCSSLSGLFTLSVRTMQVGRWRLSITTSCCRSDFSSSIWDFSSEFSVSNRSDSWSSNQRAFG